MAQSLVKTEPPKQFKEKINGNLYTWPFAMDLYFIVKNQILRGQRDLRMALNLTANAVRVVAWVAFGMSVIPYVCAQYCNSTVASTGYMSRATLLRY